MIPIVFSLIAILLGCYAAPASYDQRQDGQTNVQASLDNFLFVVLTKGSWLNELTLLDFKSVAKQIESLGDKDNEDTEPIIASEPEELDERSKAGEPYRVDIVKIPKDKEPPSIDSNEKEEKQLENKKEAKKSRAIDGETDVSKGSGSSLKVYG